MTLAFLDACRASHNGCPAACLWLEPCQGALVDDSGEQIGMLRGGEMATGKHSNVETSSTKPRACRRNLAGFIRIFRAPRDTEPHRATQSVIETGEIPSCGMGLMLVHEPCPIMEECGPIPPRNGIILLSEFRRSHPIPRRKHVGGAHDAREQRRGAPRELHAECAERRLEQGSRMPPQRCAAPHAPTTALQPDRHAQWLSRRNPWAYPSRPVRRTRDRGVGR